MVDFFSNAPDLVIDKILEKLPIHMAARTTVLSKQWRNAWLSLQHLDFGYEFQKRQKKKDDKIINWLEISRIIDSILLHHNGPVHTFDIFIPDAADDNQLNLSQWVYFLSKNGVQNLTIIRWDNCEIYITSYIFWCSELVYLKLEDFSLNPPPTCFHGFPKLKRLELLNIKFSKPNIFHSLIENCRMLETLHLLEWSGMDHVVIDAPSLQNLVLAGYFESLAFRNVCSLINIFLWLMPIPKKVITTVETLDAVNLLASSRQLQSVEFNGHMCKFLAAGPVLRSSPVTFNYLSKLRLTDLELSDFDVFRYFLSMIECCPFIKKLDIEVKPPGENVGQHIFDFNYDYKLDHLREVIIKYITGSSVELKLVEYLLAISASLENLFFMSRKCDIDVERKMSRALMRFPRASPKASLVCLDT